MMEARRHDEATKVEDTDQLLLTGSLMDEVNHRAGRGDNIGKLYLIKACKHFQGLHEHIDQ